MVVASVSQLYQSAVVAHPTLLCFHHVLKICLVLFEDDDLRTGG